MRFTVAVLTLSVLMLASDAGYAQLNTTFGDVFNEILVNRLQLSPGPHGRHFFPGARLADSVLTPALNDLVVANTSSFPLNSTGVGLTFDLSSGIPVPVAGSLGPIFSETRQTLGKGKLSVGFNYTHLALTKLRGLPTEDVRFTFTHQDVSSPPDTILGDAVNESDYIDVYLDMHVTADIYALYASYGVGQHLDVGLAIPISTVRLNGTALAVINSYTYGHEGQANHNFGSDSLNPVLETRVPYDKDAAGIGDIALRVKYDFPEGSGFDVGAVLLELRLPTGKKDDFLGSGRTRIKAVGIFSKSFDQFTPHINIAYQQSPSDKISDEIQYALGFDQRLVPGFSFAADLLGTLQLNTDKTIKLAPGSVPILFTVNRVGPGQYVRNINRSNVPDSPSDNTVSLSMGFRFQPSDQIELLGNVIVPLNDGGLRATVAPTIGVAISM
jgi:hypothetical protein